jgi:lipoteichoic acid synthase
MGKKQSRIIWYGMLVLFVLLMVRLLFFLKDGTSDIMESIFIWTIYVGSLFVIAYYLYQKKGFLNKNWIVYQDKVIFILAIFSMEIMFYIKNQMVLSKLYPISLLFILLMTLAVSLLLPKKLSRIYDIVILSFHLAYLIGQDIYYRIFHDLFSFKEAGTLREGLESAEGMYRFEWLHVLLVIVFGLCLFFYIKNKSTSHLKLSKKNLLSLFTFPVILFLLLNFNMQYPVKSARLHTSDHYLYQSVFSKKEFVSRFGTFNLSFRDLFDLMTPNFSTGRDLQYIDDYFENTIKEHEQNVYSSIFKDKNLIFILGESYDEIAFSMELTPNLYRLKTEGLDFQNHYTPVYPRTTSDTEFILNTSIIPSIEDGPTCYVYNQNSYSTSLANLFNQHGYLTTALHSNYKEFYTRHLLYQGYGYDHLYGQHEIGLSDTEMRYDSVFYQQANQYIIPNQYPFMSFIITLSGHSPYGTTNLAAEKNYEIVDDFYGDTVPESIKYYIATQIELDLFVGALFDDLNEQGLLEDTVILLTGDHYPYTLNQDDYETYSGYTENHLKQHGNLYIWSENVTHQEINLLSSSFDILPMINNMFDLGGDYAHYIGNDIFGTDGTLVYYKDYSFFDGINHTYLSEMITNGNQMNMNQSNTYYELSKKILRTNYFKV